MGKLSHSRQKRYCTHPLIAVIFVVLCFLLIGCDVQVKVPAVDSVATSVATAVSDGTTGGTSATSQGIKLFVQPQDGEEAVIDAIAGAKKSVWVKVYLMSDREVIDALTSAAKKGKDVRVMLESRPYGGGGLSPREVTALLQKGGVQVKTTNTKFRLTHEKSMVVDGATAYIMTCNLSSSALGGKNREYGVIDSQPDDVKAVIDIFNADWNRTEAKLTNPHLVVSPINSRKVFSSLINEARSTLEIQAEVLNDDEIEELIADAGRRGVNVQVIIPNTSGSLEEGNDEGSTTLKSGNVAVKESSGFYMHAKMILVDKKKAYIGSINISTSSFDKNRELGIVVSDTTVLQTLSDTFKQDWAKGKVHKAK